MSSTPAIEILAIAGALIAAVAAFAQIFAIPQRGARALLFCLLVFVLCVLGWWYMRAHRTETLTVGANSVTAPENTDRGNHRPQPSRLSPDPQGLNIQGGLQKNLTIRPQMSQPRGPLTVDIGGILTETESELLKGSVMRRLVPKADKYNIRSMKVICSLRDGEPLLGGVPVAAIFADWTATLSSGIAIAGATRQIEAYGVDRAVARASAVDSVGAEIVTQLVDQLSRK